MKNSLWAKNGDWHAFPAKPEVDMRRKPHMKYSCRLPMRCLWDTLMVVIQCAVKTNWRTFFRLHKSYGFHR